MNGARVERSTCETAAITVTKSLFEECGHHVVGGPGARPPQEDGYPETLLGGASLAAPVPARGVSPRGGELSEVPDAGRADRSGMSANTSSAARQRSRAVAIAPEAGARRTTFGGLNHARTPSCPRRAPSIVDERRENGLPPGAVTGSRRRGCSHPIGQKEVGDQGGEPSRVRGVERQIRAICQSDARDPR